jgi:hypothetical protein
MRPPRFVTGTLEVVAWLLAFCLVIAGAALIPGPVRATHPLVSVALQGAADDGARRKA